MDTKLVYSSYNKNQISWKQRKIKQKQGNQ